MKQFYSKSQDDSFSPEIKSLIESIHKSCSQGIQISNQMRDLTTARELVINAIESDLDRLKRKYCDHTSYSDRETIDFLKRSIENPIDELKRKMIEWLEKVSNSNSSEKFSFYFINQQVEQTLEQIRDSKYEMLMLRKDQLDQNFDLPDAHRD